MDVFKRLSALDSLRGLAAIGVAFFWHYQHFGFVAGDPGQPFFKIFSWFYLHGTSLVDLFFVISGFIFMHVYAIKLSEHKIDFKHFMLLRLTRLYPLHMLTLFLATLFIIIRFSLNLPSYIYQSNDVWHFVLNLVMLQTGIYNTPYSFNGPAWSISVEIIAYVLFFFILKKIKEKNFTFFIGIILGIFMIESGVALPLINSSIGRILLGFFTGCLLQQINHRLNLINNQTFRTISVGVIITIVFLFNSILNITIHFQSTFPVYTLMLYPAIILIILHVNFLKHLLSMRPLSYLGEISYSIYLWHFPIQIIFWTINNYFPINFRSYITFFVFVGITLLTSSLSYHYFEQPIQDFIRRKYIIKKVDSIA